MFCLFNLHQYVIFRNAVCILYEKLSDYQLNLLQYLLKSRTFGAQSSLK